MVPLKATATNNTVAPVITTLSRRTASGCTARGLISAAAPTISIIFAMLLPITLPTAMPGEPASAASTLTTSSGADVPKPTMVSPTINGEIPIRRAIPTAPRTRPSPPARSKNRPARVINKFMDKA